MKATTLLCAFLFAACLPTLCNASTDVQPSPRDTLHKAQPETLYVFLPSRRHKAEEPDKPSRPIAQTIIGAAMVIPTVAFAINAGSCFSEAERIRNSDEWFSDLSADMKDADGTVSVVAACAFGIAGTVLCVIAKSKWDKYNAYAGHLGIQYDPDLRKVGLVAQVAF